MYMKFSFGFFAYL